MVNNIYAVSGLGADARVFDYLNMRSQIIVLDWIRPQQKEAISDYAHRLSKKIDPTQPFVLIGVSFGGLVAVEIAKYIVPQQLILISSASTRHELPRLYRLLGKTNIVSWIPERYFDPPRILAFWLFDTQQRQLLTAILNDTDLYFAKWAVNQLVQWQNNTTPPNCIQIKGDKDRLLPPAKGDGSIIIKNGGHFMIVDKAIEVEQNIIAHISNMKKKITGTVKYIQLGTGFWGIIGNDGQEYRPINMPESLKTEGKKVSVSAKTVDGGVSIFMWGTDIKILDYSK